MIVVRNVLMQVTKSKFGMKRRFKDSKQQDNHEPKAFVHQVTITMSLPDERTCRLHRLIAGPTGIIILSQLYY